MQCSNHLNQIGLAIHNFHDARDGIVPSCVLEGSFRCSSSFGLLYPFMEQDALYQLIAKEPAVNVNGTDGVGWQVHNNWWGQLTDDQRKGFASVSTYMCPTRRSGTQMNDNRTADPNEVGRNVDGGGPLGDYAVVFADQAGGDGWWQHHRVTHTNFVTGPFRLAINHEFITKLSWDPRDTFARVSDGLSNQFFIGEKHIPLNRLGNCPNKADSWADAERTRSMGDCSYLQTGFLKSAFSGRALVHYEVNSVGDAALQNSENIHALLRPQDYSEDNVPSHITYHSPIRGIAFGSWHPGVCPFVLGDGSVRSVAVTTALPILRAYAVVDDGESVALP
jgi:hypothetical protein